MGEIADDHEMRLCDPDEDAEEEHVAFLWALRQEILDMQLERDRDFGDKLVEHLERRKRLSRALTFLNPWRERSC